MYIYIYDFLLLAYSFSNLLLSIHRFPFVLPPPFSISPHLIVFVLTLITDHFSRLWHIFHLVRQWLTIVFISFSPATYSRSTTTTATLHRFLARAVSLHPRWPRVFPSVPFHPSIQILSLPLFVINLTCTLSLLFPFISLKFDWKFIL